MNNLPIKKPAAKSLRGRSGFPSIRMVIVTEREYNKGKW
jgi:hypothetical protein